QPFWIVELDSDHAAEKIASRSVTVRCIVDLWASAIEMADLHRQLHSLPSEWMRPYSSPEVSFKIKVETFCNSQTQEEKVDKIESFNYLPLNGPVRLKHPDLVLQFIEYFGLEPNSIPKKPLHVFFGRVVAEGQRDLINKFSLKKRKFIGNTSMDPQLSLIMANQAKVKDGSLVLDPFAGTGSLLIAAAQFGGYVIGTDIDYLMIHGKSRPTRKQHRDRPRHNESVLSNMQQYGLSHHYLDMVVADASLPLWKPSLVLDAVITDPPYGIREAMERVGTSREGSGAISEEYLGSHIPSKVQYSMHQLMDDLLRFSANHLVLGGRLVTWIPVIRNEYNEEKSIPKHDCLELVSNSEQILSTASSRRLLTYEKICDPKNKTSSENVPSLNDETFREKYYKIVEEIRRDRKLKSSPTQRGHECADGKT
ncbi:hypothetical protein AAG570_002122, partial [Ranatra chinensis]